MIACSFFRLLFFTRAYTSICLFSSRPLFTTSPNIDVQRAAASIHWKRISSRFCFCFRTTCHSENHKFGACSVCFDTSMSRDYRVRFDSVPCNDSPSSLWVSLVRNVLLFQLNLECFHVYISFFFVVKRIQLRSGKWWLRTIDHIIFFHRRPNAHALHIFKRQIRVRRQFPLCICIVQTEKCGHCSYNYTSAPSTNHSSQTTISEIETITHFAK